MKKFMDLDQQLFQDVWQTYYDPSELEVKGKQLCVCGPKPYDPAGAGRNKNVLLAPAAPVQGDELVTVRTRGALMPQSRRRIASDSWAASTRPHRRRRSPND